MKRIYLLIVSLCFGSLGLTFSQSVIVQTVADSSMILPASASVPGPGMIPSVYGDQINGWEAGSASWTIQIVKASDITIYANYTSDYDDVGMTVNISNGFSLSTTTPGTGGWGTFLDVPVGQVTLNPGTYTFSMGVTNHAINFRQVRLTRKIVPLTLTTSANNPDFGFVVRTPYNDTYEISDSVKLTAIPYPGYKLSSWSGDLTSSNPEDTLVMSGNKTVVANFEPGGSVSPDVQGNMVLPSAAATLSSTGIAYNGTAISSWTTGNATWIIEVPCETTYTLQAEISGLSTPVSDSLNITINSLNVVGYYTTPGGGSDNYAFRNLRKVTLQPGIYSIQLSRIFTGADNSLNLKTLRFLSNVEAEASLTVNLFNVAGSGIDFTNVMLEGPWSTQLDPGSGNINVYDATKTDESMFTPATGVLVFNTGSNSYQVTMPFVSTNNPDCKFTIRTNDGRRFGLWSFDGTKNDTLNIQTYSTIQSYNTGTNTATRDYKLLALVDGSANNPLRNNKYLSVGNGGITIGGGGLMIVKDTTDGGNESVILDNTVTPIGSTVAGQLSAGFIVVDSLADFIVNGTLNMQTGASNATDIPTGQRLIVEKGFNSCGIFALDGGTLSTDANFLSFYHHVMDGNQWSWLSHPESISLTYGAPIDKLLYASNTPASSRFTSQRTNGANLYLYAYDEPKRATTVPNLEVDGVAWSESSGPVKGFITSIDNNTASARDLYVQIANQATFQNQQWNSVNVSFMQCTRLDQYQKAAAALRKPIPATIAMADQDTKDMVGAYNSGWNLIGNPYTKSYAPDVSMGTVALPDPGEGDGYIYQNAEGTYVPNDGNFNIPPLTAFFVQAQKGTGSDPEFYSSKPINITGTLSTTNNMALRSSQALSELAIIRVDLLQGEKQLGQTVLSFSKGATFFMDWGLDAMLMKIASYDIYLLDKMGFAMAINAVDENYGDSFTVPIGINISQAGNYAFRISEIKNMPGVGLILKEGNKETEMHEGDVYPFAITTKGKNENTFALASIKQSTGIEEIADADKPVVYVENERIVVDNIREESEIRILNIMGRIMNKANTPGPKYSFLFETPGYYLIQIVQRNKTYVFKVSI